MPRRSTATFWSSSLPGRSTKVLLVCHGENEAVPLRERFRSAPLSAVYSSEMSHALRTAEIIAEPHRLSVQTEPDINETAPGGEAIEELRDRAVRALAKIAAAHPGGTVVVVGHKNLNSALICNWLGLSIGRYLEIEQKDAAVNSVVFDGNRVVIETVNDVCHNIARSPDLT